MQNSASPLLIVEDSDEDFAALQRIMQRFSVANPIHHFWDGDEILEFLYEQIEVPPTRRDPSPSVILLDLNLPGTDGRTVLTQVKQDKALKEIPVVIFTTSDNPQDIEFCYQTGANGYLVKPVSLQALYTTIQSFVDYWLQVNMPPTGIAPTSV